MHLHRASRKGVRVRDVFRVRIEDPIANVLRVMLLVLTALLFCGAGTDASRHYLVVDFEEDSCQTALRSFVESNSDTLFVLRPHWRTHYRIETEYTLDLDIDALWEQVHAHWRIAEFERALEDADVALEAFGSHGPDTLSDALISIVQLRITTLLLQGNKAQADTEGALLLSRQPAAFYCADTAFPEACELLQALEARSSLRWQLSDVDRDQLSEFSKQTDRRLSVISRPHGVIRWELIESGEPTRHHLSEGDCSTQIFWADTFQDWNALLSNDIVWTPPPPPSAIALQRTMRIGVPIAATVFSGLAIASTVNLQRRRTRYDGCLVSAKNCATYDDIQDSKVKWVRARRSTAAAWTAVGVVGLSPIPLALFKKRALKRSSASAAKARLRE